MAWVIAGKVGGLMRAITEMRRVQASDTGAPFVFAHMRLFARCWVEASAPREEEEEVEEEEEEEGG